MADNQIRDKWDEAFHPGEVFLTEEERCVLAIPESNDFLQKQQNALWLRIFCPQASCEITSPCQLA